MQGLHDSCNSDRCSSECHAAIILFSRRAIDESDWVKKEATILSWRAELDDAFKLFPVLLDQQTTPADLEKDLFGTLRINRLQCVQNVVTAQQIMAGIRPLLGEPDELGGAWQTPFDDLLAAVETLISEEISLASLKHPPFFAAAVSGARMAAVLISNFMVAGGEGKDCWMG